MERTKIMERTQQAAKAYLNNERGYVVVAENYECKAGKIDFVSMTDEALVFTKFIVVKDGFEDEGEYTRGEFEQIAASFLSENEYVDIKVRFDIMQLRVLADDKAFVRYHVNALGVIE